MALITRQGMRLAVLGLAIVRFTTLGDLPNELDGLGGPVRIEDGALDGNEREVRL